jgi:hypothetical protein
MKNNSYRIRVSELAEQYGYDNTDDFVLNECQDSVVPACCTEGCEVEPDGRCEHGCASPLLVLGLI